ncbi:MAG: hypothetical protein PHF00_09575 [Elusimicrobia bacterium]|nr:hypothetical protein [Elusimicrobiota bacterium]
MRAIATSLAALWLCAGAGAAEILPIGRLQLLGGQAFARGQRNALTGNASGVLAAAVRFDEALALLPSLQSSYQGTQQAVDIIGAGTLLQERLDLRAGTRLVWSVPGSRWRLKPALSYKHELLKETKDERWGGGLFDSRKWSVGAQAEYVWRDPFSWRFDLDYYQTAFPNYVSLEAQAASRFGPGVLARELAGERVLDSRSVSLAASVDGPARERLVWEASLGAVLRRFPEQRIVGAAGELTGPARDDVLAEVRLAARMPAQLNGDLRVRGGLELGLAYNSSNQNNYDAVEARYTPFYYNYGELRVRPALDVVVGPPARPAVLGLGWSWRCRRYPYRTARDASGLYSNGTMHDTSWNLDAALRYPMAKRLGLLFEVQYGQAASNDKLERFFRYNYVSASYLIGVSYEY